MPCMYPVSIWHQTYLKPRRATQRFKHELAYAQQLCWLLNSLVIELTCTLCCVVSQDWLGWRSDSFDHSVVRPYRFDEDWVHKFPIVPSVVPPRSKKTWLNVQAANDRRAPCFSLLRFFENGKECMVFLDLPNKCRPANWREKRRMNAIPSYNDLSHPQLLNCLYYK